MEYEMEREIEPEMEPGFVLWSIQMRNVRA